MKNTENLMFFISFSMTFVDFGSGSFQNHGKSMKLLKKTKNSLIIIIT